MQAFLDAESELRADGEEASSSDGEFMPCTKRWSCKSMGGCSDSGEVSTETEGFYSDEASSVASAGSAAADAPPSPLPRLKQEPSAPSTPVAMATEEDLVAEEEQLRRRVPELLESMNRASADVNSLERQCNVAQSRYRSNVAECNALYSELRAKNGRTFDRVKPYFSAAEEVKAASHRLQTIARDFSAASAEHTAAQRQGRPEAEVVSLQLQRDRHEDEYVRALREHRSAQETLETLRVQIGDAAIRRSLPAFQSLQQRQLKLAVEQSRMNTLAGRAHLSKGLYQNSLRELERISAAVHDIRKLHARQAVQA
mmetsp:Transcript_89867/g.232997  ORF Transcript_89867/g.232997 Transcript_89867/m.232997 type:complete len:313 (+) Transcript_89867:59-997(+)